MRDTIRYPITKDEIVLCLESFLKQIDHADTELVGDMRPILLLSAIDIVRKSGGPDGLDR